jgi:cation-transporting P-type ATPase E
MNDPKLQGLTAAQVEERIRQGQVNRVRRSHWRDYRQIIARNVLNWYNAMVTPAAVALLFLREYPGAIAVSGMAIVNSAIGLVQEIRAKQYLDKLTILVESKARVVRDGQVQEIPAGDVVLGDHILLASGETVVADGPVLAARFLEVDEALLTGESDPVRRQPGERLLSGSFCVAGEGTYRADKVGGESFAQATSAEARAYKYTASPLTTIINRLIQVLSFTAFGLCLLYTVAYFLDVIADERTYVQMAAATITSMVPQGMVLTATLSMLLGAMHMGAKGAIVQRLAAVETMAAIDVICTDKTGTLTTNRLKLDSVKPLAGHREEDVRQRLREFASASPDQKNKNVQALRAALGETNVQLLDALPFKSQNRYSAVRIRDAGGAERVLAMGACEALRDELSPSADGGWETAWNALLPSGLRLLMFAEAVKGNEPFAPFKESLAGFALDPLALICLSDELRPEAGAVLESLAAQGIAFKVISGDNPETVRATVSHLKLPLARDPVVTGDELAKASQRDELIRTRSVFGRVSPHQKVEIVEALKSQGAHVAMIGDGVNDVLPIKRADLGIAMGEGSQAAKTVSGLVLENNNFALLPETLEEGRTIIRNLRRSAKLFLVKNVYSLILILCCVTGLFGLRFPYLPQQVTLLNWLVIGLPALVITFSRERSTAATRPRFLAEVGWFAIRTGVVFALTGLALLLVSRLLWPEIGYERRHDTQRTMLLSLLILLGITALFRALRDAEPATLVGDRRFRLLGVIAIPTYLLTMYLPPAARFFVLTPLDLAQWAVIVVLAAAGYGFSVWTDHWRVGFLKPPAPRSVTESEKG